MSTDSTRRNGQYEAERGSSHHPRFELAPVDTAGPPPRSLGLTLTPLGAAGEFDEAEPLVPREYRGLGQLFTPNLKLTRQCPGVAYKPDDAFSTSYHVLPPDVAQDPRLAGQVQPLAFTPVFDWVARGTAVMLTKLTSHGQRVLHLLQAAHDSTPIFKAYIRWDKRLNRHRVGHQPLPPPRPRSSHGCSGRTRPSCTRRSNSWWPPPWKTCAD